MHTFILFAASVLFLSGLFTVQAQNGFVIWSKGGGCDRTLMYNEIKGGTPRPEKVAVEKDTGADIFVQISYDGTWIAYARSIGAFDGYSNNKNGRCDYHMFDQYDIYIANVDNGNIIPAQGIKVAHGTWPSWGNDSDKDNKTLYWSDMDQKGIAKATIGPDGSVSDIAMHATVPNQYWGGTSRHFQCSDDGKYVAYRPSDAAMYIQDAASGKTIGKMDGGQHPAWGPQGYIMHTKNQIFRVQGDSIKNLDRAGLGAYWYNFSNDIELPNKIWIIGKIGGGKQNDAGATAFKEVDVSNDGWNVEPGLGTILGLGTGGDIHIWGPVGIAYKNKMNKIDNTYDTKVRTGANGLQLVIRSQKLAGYTAGLYNMQGKQVTSIRMSGSSQNIMPLSGITDGKYLLNLSNGKISTQRSIWIFR